MTNRAIWELLTPLQAEALEELAAKSNVAYQHTMATIRQRVDEGMDVQDAIDDTVGYIL
jgi:hypothetical protein